MNVSGLHTLLDSNFDIVQECTKRLEAGESLSESQLATLERLDNATDNAMLAVCDGLRGLGEVLGSIGMKSCDLNRGAEPPKVDVDGDLLDDSALQNLGWLIETLARNALTMAQLSAEIAYAKQAQAVLDARKTAT